MFNHTDGARMNSFPPAEPVWPSGRLAETYTQPTKTLEIVPARKICPFLGATLSSVMPRCILGFEHKQKSFSLGSAVMSSLKSDVWVCIRVPFVLFFPAQFQFFHWNGFSVLRWRCGDGRLECCAMAIVRFQAPSNIAFVGLFLNNILVDVLLSQLNFAFFSKKRKGNLFVIFLRRSRNRNYDLSKFHPPLRVWEVKQIVVRK